LRACLAAEESEASWKSARPRFCEESLFCVFSGGDLPGFNR
jgi:hypothetical protein